MRKHLLFFILPFVLAACAEPTVEPTSEPQGSVQHAAFDQEFDLRAGGIVNVGGDALTIAFRRVGGDSRCPLDAVCVWMGDATVQLDVTVGRMAWTPRELHTHLDPKRTTFREFAIELVSLTPYPRSDRTIAPEEYVARLRVTRA